MMYPKYEKKESDAEPTFDPKIEGSLITFTKRGSLPKQLEKEIWPVNSSYKVKFAGGHPPVEVTLIDGDSDCSKPLSILAGDNLIFSDFESVPFESYEDGDVTINAFTFCCSSGVFVFHCRCPNGNAQLGQFLSKKPNVNFFTFGIRYLRMNIQRMFGYDIETDIEDIWQTRLQPGQFPRQYKFIEKFCKDKLCLSSKEFGLMKPKMWSEKNLNFRQVLHTAFIAFGLSLCYPNIPPPINKPYRNFFDNVDFDEDRDESDDNDPKGQSIDYGKISFSDVTPLSSFKDSKWTLRSFAEIEFFPDHFTKVFLLDAEKDLPKFAPKISCDDVIFFDMEYLPLDRVEAAPVCLFQFCSSEGAFLFRQRTPERNDEMRQFLSIENGLKFVGKGIPGDIDRLKRFFGNDFQIDIEDVELTRLRPYKFSLNFEKMVEKFAGNPSDLFKDKKVSCSNWNSKKLKKIQVIYSAFDVVALFHCYPNFYPPKSATFSQNGNKKFDPKKKLFEYAASIKMIDVSETDSNKINANEFWESNSDLAIRLIDFDFDMLKFAILHCLSVVKGNKLQCKKCQKFRSKYVRRFIEHCKIHFDNEAAEDADMNVKELFLNFLNLTGRVSIDKLRCYVCNGYLDSTANLCDHCWNSHSAIIKEIICPIDPNIKEEDNDDGIDNS